MNKASTRFTFQKREEAKGYYPITDSGNMLEFLYNESVDAVYWKKMEPFTASLMYLGFEQGRSSVRFILQDVNTKACYSLMCNSFDSFLTKAEKGVLTAEFIVVKRGANYGLLLTEDL